MIPSRTRLSLVGLLIACSSIAHSQVSPAADWEGAIRIMGMHLGIKVHFTTPGDSLRGTIDIPMQNALGLPLTNVSWTPPECSFDLPAGPGLASFRGVVRGDSITGPFTQAGMKGDFILRPAVKEKHSSTQPLPYVEEEVAFASDDAVLAGTLTIPKGTPPFPAAVMVTGSGAQNRDEQIFDFAPFRIIADHLTRRGIAVLRYDDRGVGKSTGTFPLATTRTFAADAWAALGYLRKEKRIAPDRIGIIGHSEGGIAGTIVAAAHKEVAFLLLLAAPAVSGDSLINFQVAGGVRRAGKSEEEVERVLNLQRKIYDAVRSGTGFDRIEGLLLEEGRASLRELPEEERSAFPDSVLRLRIKGQMTSIRSAWFREFIMLDPALELRRVGCPVLALFGETDQQVPPTLNRQPMESAFQAGGNSDVSIRLFPETNHLFLHSATGDPAEYPSLKKEFVPGFLEAMSGWLVQRFVR